MTSEKTKNIEGINYKFIISITKGINNSAIFVHVKVSPNDEDRFHKDRLHKKKSKSEILAEIASHEAKSVNPKAFFKFASIDLGNEWKGQFNL